MNFTKKKHLARTLDVGTILKNTYVTKMPRIIQKGINWLVNQIPFADFVLTIQKEMEVTGNDSKEFMSNRLYELTDNYIRNTVLGNNRLSWILWIFLFNIIAQLLFYYFVVK